ncbi:histidinol-phosphate transaminase [Polaromonas sp. YR568]|uniref:pyridoxal phosphate-dependent aminotransferase n=1 Tax=Polaromonas sp. YR568 TaxID=1855301 RepID=UPI0031379E07
MKPPVRPAVLASPDYPFSPVDAAIKLDQNESAEDFPAPLKALVLERLAQQDWHRYPDLNSDRLRAAIASHDSWPAPGVVVTTGSNVLISLLIQMSALEGRVITVKPNFALYGLDARLLGAALTEVPLKVDYTIDVDAVIDALTSTLPSDGPTRSAPAGVIYVPRPHAPTGSLVALQDLERLADASTGWLLVIDEAYHQFCGTDATALARRYPHVVLLRTFSKAWGLAGVRLGYALASDHIAAQLQKLVPPFAVSVMQTICAEVALAHPGYMHDRVAATLAERERVSAALADYPSWQVIPSHGNFLLIRTPDAAAAFNALLARGVLVRRQDSHPGLEGCIRVSIGTRADNDAFLKAAGVGASR